MNESAAALVERAAPIRVRQDNPKKGASALRYAKYMAATTAKEFISLGGTRADLKHDINKGFVKVLVPAAAPGFAFMRNVPDDILLILLGHCDASSLLALETASRAFLDLLRSPARHKQQEALWCGCLRSRFPREGPALCSLGNTERRLGLRPRAPARQLYKAFCTKKDAVMDIEEVPLEGGEDALEELAFIAVVGDFAGLASWDEEIHGGLGHTLDFLRWQPPSVRLGPFENLGEATVPQLRGDRVRQELHVIDLRTFLCVSLLSPTVPDEVVITNENWGQTPPYLQDGDQVYFGKACGNFMWSSFTYKGCLLSPSLAVRPTANDSRLLFADFFPEEFVPGDLEGELWDDSHMALPRCISKSGEVCEFVAEVIRQTHSPLRRYGVAA